MKCKKPTQWATKPDTWPLNTPWLHSSPLDISLNTELTSLHLLFSKNTPFQIPSNGAFVLKVTWEFLDASVIISFSPEDWISAFSELFMEFSIEDCEFCSSEVSEMTRNDFKQINQSIRQEFLGCPLNYNTPNPYISPTCKTLMLATQNCWAQSLEGAKLLHTR